MTEMGRLEHPLQSGPEHLLWATPGGRTSRFVATISVLIFDNVSLFGKEGLRGSFPLPPTPSCKGRENKHYSNVKCVGLYVILNNVDV
jgi:hypothetical protein